MNMLKYFSSKYIDYLPPWHYVPKTAKSIAGIECNGEIDEPQEDKAQEVLRNPIREKNENEENTGISEKNREKIIENVNFNFDAIGEKLQKLFGEKQLVEVKVHNIEDIRESIKNNYSFFYFLVIVVLLVVIVLSVWNFMTIRAVRNIAKIQQRVSFETNLLDNIQA
ncbi:uncharacterized protein LOC129606413 [Condylostylus longicornis]|uniref:uncharacterized protein LOC129606413 n=1 Tax=Condylostylus longicornis TaxID=2530218 RepID=UPI00244E5A34|nr:uncharacterized protein LOC129606413 [Condylostylus longicornis]